MGWVDEAKINIENTNGFFVQNGIILCDFDLKFRYLCDDPKTEATQLNLNRYSWLRQKLYERIGLTVENWKMIKLQCELDSDYTKWYEFMDVRQMVKDQFPKPNITIEDKIRYLWTAYDNYYNKTMLSVSIDEKVINKWQYKISVGEIQSGSARANKIDELDTWSDNLWAQYAIDKNTIINGEDVTLDLETDFPLPDGVEFWNINSLSATV
jgi:hypothetical protein